MSGLNPFPSPSGDSSPRPDYRRGFIGARIVQWGHGLVWLDRLDRCLPVSLKMKRVTEGCSCHAPRNPLLTGLRVMSCMFRHHFGSCLWIEPDRIAIRSPPRSKLYQVLRIFDCHGPTIPSYSCECRASSSNGWRLLSPQLRWSYETY